jgi:hypothetical protein
MMYEVVADRPILEIISGVSLMTDKSESEINADGQKSEAKADQIPRGYMEEVGSLVTINPRREILFSMPANHLSKRWHIEIPFEFGLPKGKGPRDPNNGGEPQMVVTYSLWDLPPKSRAEIGK